MKERLKKRREKKDKGKWIMDNEGWKLGRQEGKSKKRGKIKIEEGGKIEEGEKIEEGGKEDRRKEYKEG